MRYLLLAVMLAAACAPEVNDIGVADGAAGSSFGVSAEALAAQQPCTTGQVNAIKAKLQGPLYYCLSSHWTFDTWNLRNDDCSSTSEYGVWVPASRGNGVSTCSFAIRRIDDDGNPSGYCAWKLGTVNSSNVVTIANDVNSCW